MRNKSTKVYKGSRTISSRRWLERQLNDEYVIQAKEAGYRSRAAFKIIEIDDKFKIFKNAKVIIDLGAAPGGWSQVAASRASKDAIIVAIDLLPFDNIAKVTNHEMDFTDPNAEIKIMELLQNQGYNDQLVDIVMSDMAANTTGHKPTDHLRIIDLCERSFYFASKILKPGGIFIAKIFRGGAENDLLQQVKQSFASVKHFKPKSSRAESTEMYLIAKGFRRNENANS